MDPRAEDGPVESFAAAVPGAVLQRLKLALWLAERDAGASCHGMHGQLHGLANAVVAYGTMIESIGRSSFAAENGTNLDRTLSLDACALAGSTGEDLQRWLTWAVDHVRSKWCLVHGSMMFDSQQARQNSLAALLLGSSGAHS